MAYCGIVASGLYWRISQAEARLVERRKDREEQRKPKIEPPAAWPHLLNAVEGVIEQENA